MIKIIKAKIQGNDTLYIVKTKGLIRKKTEIYWISQNTALPVVDVSAMNFEAEGKEGK